MSVRITGRHMEVTDGMREYVEKKLKRLSRYMERVQSVEVIFEHDHGYEYKAELLVKDGPVSVTAKTKDAQWQRAVDMLVDKAERQLKKKWEKVRGATKKQKAKGAAKELGFVEEETSEEEEEETAEEPGAPVAVATRKKKKQVKRQLPTVIEKLDLYLFPPEEVDVSTMSVAEAAESLFFNDQSFLAFRDSETGDLMVVYRRNDGNIGVLKPVIP